MEIRSLLLVLLMCYCVQAVVASDEPVVSTASGDVQGTVRYANDLLDKPVYTFLGIPYAAPPVGHLRFRNPEPAAPWKGIRNATKIGPYCPQVPGYVDLIPWKLPHYDFDEDCLTLNIETPTVDKDAGLPVLLWFHSGALVMGMGHLVPFAAMAAHQDVVVVTMNYRVGAFGFFSTGDEHAPGNFGFLDQLEAMKWVKENIRNFGGDPDQVTIFGKGGGGASVCYHMVSPLSKGLFHRAISQGGTCNTMRLHPRPVKYAVQIAEQVGCDTENTAAIVACLRQKTADELVVAEKSMMPVSFYVIFFPVIDGTFLPAHPDHLYDKGQAHTVDYLLGMNSHDFGYMVPLTQNPTFGQGKTWEYFLGKVKGVFESERYQLDHVKDKIVAAVRELYRDHDNPDDPMAIQHQYTLWWGDVYTVAPTVDTANRHAASGSKVYMFEHHYVPSFLSATRPSWVGSDHHDDLLTMTGMPFLDVQSNYGFSFPFSPADKMVSRDMMAYWANFARTGNPSDPIGGPADSPAVPEWPQYTPDNLAYMKLDLTSSADVGLHPERMALWNDVIPKMAARDEL